MTKKFKFFSAGSTAAGGANPEQSLEDQLNAFAEQHPDVELATITELGGNFAQRHLFAWVEYSE